MSDIIAIILSLAALAASCYGYFRSRYWAKRAETAAEEANLAYFRAHDSAMEAEENANRT